MSKCFVFSGDWGSGKTVLALSYRPFGFPKNKVPVRLLIDPELRAGTYKSEDEKDDKEKLLFAYRQFNEKQFDANLFYLLMAQAHKENWDDKPDVLIIDDIATVQDKMNSWWNDANLRKTASLYGMENHFALKDWASEPAKISLKKKLFGEFMVDLRSHNIDLVITSPLKNIWQDYGKKGYNPVDKKPWMRIIGTSANIWSCFEQFADVIWILDRQDKYGKLKTLPTVTMDLFIPKAALPGVKEQFEWPGWDEVWKQHKERTNIADVSKLEKPEPKFTPEQIENMLKQGKFRLMSELENIPPDEVKAIMKEEDAPEYTLEDHDKIKKYILRTWESRQSAKPKKVEKNAE